MNKKLSLNETLERIKEISGINEIDFEKDFSDIGANCISNDTLVEFLNSELARLDHNKMNKGNIIKIKPRDPIIARGSLESVISDNPEETISNFITNVTADPGDIFVGNPKMEKSDIGRPQLTLTTGLPAITGIVYDEDKYKFFLVSTCPGAGVCMLSCYARKHFYLMSDEKSIRLTRILNLLLNKPEEYKKRVLEQLKNQAELLKQSSVGRSIPFTLFLRWNDAGDFFGSKYLNIAKEVTMELIKMGYNVRSYAYTKTGKYVMELNQNKNFIVTFSTDAKPKEVQLVNTLDIDKSQKEKIKRSIIVPEHVFSGFFQKDKKSYVKAQDGLPIFKYAGAEKDLKKSVYEYVKSEGYDIDPKSLVYTYELPHSETKHKNKYNVIVLPTGDSDIAAQRKDCWLSLLLIH